MRIKDSNKIDLIFKASLKLILGEGIAGLTMLKLAKQAGVATGTLYIYFKSKEKLLHALYQKLNSESSERFMKGYVEQEPFRIGFRKIWLNYLTHRIEHYEESVFMEQYYRSPYISAADKKKTESMKVSVLELIKRGKKEMLVKNNIDDEILLFALLGLIRELADEHVTKSYKLDQSRIEKAFLISWDMIKA